LVLTTQPLPVRRRRERLLPVIEEAVAMARESLAGTGRDPSVVFVRIDVPEGLGVEMARRHIVGAVANVVKNAIESYASGLATFHTGGVHIAARLSEADRVEVTVEDDLEQLRQFIPGRTTKRQSQGTGFGLPIAERNIRAHRGRLGIASETGKGTTMTMILPVHQQEGEEL